LRRDLACAALGLALAGAYWAAARELPRSMLSDAVGADGVPRALAVLLAFFSVFIAMSALLRKRKVIEDRQNHARALGIAVLGFAYIAIAPLAGYLVSGTLLAGAAALYYGAPRNVDTVAFATGSAALLWLVFGRVLGIALP
jgi:putative tricarboxylic transport membrane protein